MPFNWRQVRRHSKILVKLIIVVFFLSAASFNLFYDGVALRINQFCERLRQGMISLQCIDMSDHAQIFVRTAIHRYCSEHKSIFLSIQDFSEYIQNSCPFVLEVSCSFSLIPFLYSFVIQGIKPVCLINNNYVLSKKNNRLHEKKLFDCYKLPEITLDGCWCCEHLDDRVAHFIYSLSLDRYRQFSITYHDSFFIDLKFKDDALKNIRCYITDSYDKWDDLCGWAQRAINDVQVSIKKKKNKRDISIIVDMRFGQNVIVRFS